MRNKLKVFKNQVTFKRLLILLGALFLSVSIGSGVKSAFAGQDIQSVLTNWFDSQKTESINQIDKAITAEKELLMADLKKELQADMKQADEELTQFTNQEIEQRVNELRKYADKLLATMQVDNSEDNKAISANLEVIYEQAIKQMNEVTPSTQAPLASEQNLVEVYSDDD